MLRALAAAAGTLLAAEALNLRRHGDIPKFEVNLDLPPEDRWSHITAYFKDVWRMTAELPHLASHLTPEQYRGFTSSHHWPEEYLAEVRGIVRDVNDSRLTVNRVLINNMLYNLNYPVFCSGLLAADESGQVTQGRNLDYAIHGMKMDGRELGIRDILHELTFVRGGKPIFVSISMVGQLGVHTAMTLTEPRWSFQQNTHDGNDLKRNLQAALSGGLDYQVYVRTLMEQGLDFTTAVQRLESQAFMAPQYFIMAGQRPWEGAVLEIQRGVAAGEAKSNAQVLSPAINRWFLMQTNDRLWDKPFDGRRPKGIEMMSAMGQKQAGPNAVLKTLREPPVFNKETVYAFVTVPATGYYRLVMHDDVVDPNGPPV